MAQVFDPNTQEAGAGGSLEFEASLGYRLGSQDYRRNPVWKTQTKTKTSSTVS